MADDREGVVSVTRRMGVPAHEVFVILRDPARHQSFDGSGMVRGVKSGSTVSAVGDVFVMEMHADEMGDYETTSRVIELEPGRRLTWEPTLTKASKDEHQDGVGRSLGQRWGYDLEPDGAGGTRVTETFDCSRSPGWLRTALDNGNRWASAMADSLELLEKQCLTGSPSRDVGGTA